MTSLAVDESVYRAASVKIDGGAIRLELMNGRKVEAPLWLFEELDGFTKADFSDVELIGSGRGILVGDREAVTVARIMGLDSSDSEAKADGLLV